MFLFTHPLRAALFTATAFFLLSSSVSAQPVVSADSVRANYSVYSVLVGTVRSADPGDASGAFYNSFRGLADMGHLYHETVKDAAGVPTTRVFLGSYLGKRTADRVMTEVKRRGYTGVSLNIQREFGGPPSAMNVVQLASFEGRLDMRPFLTLMKTEGPGSVLAVIAKDGSFKVLSGYGSTDAALEALRSRLRTARIDHFKRSLNDIL